MSYKDEQKAARAATKSRLITHNIPNSRRNRRRRIINRLFTKKGYREGRKI